MVLLVAAAQPAQDLDRLLERGLVEVDLLDAPGQGAVLLDVLELLERGGAHQPDLAFRQHGLDQVREVHGAAGGRAGPDHGVHLVDEEDGPRPLLERVEHGLEALLEVAAITGPSQEGARVEGEDLGALEDLGGVRLEEAEGQPFDQRRLAHAGVAHEDGVVLAPPGQDLERALQLGQPPDQRVQLPLPAALGEVHAVRAQGITRGGRALLAGAPRRDVRLRRVTGHLRDPVRDVVEDVEPAHALAGQEVDGVGAALGQQRGQDVAHVRLRLPRALHVQDGRLQDAAEGEGLIGRALGPEGQGLEVLVEERVEVGLDLLGVGAGRAQDLVPARLVEDREEEMLQGQVGMAPGDRLPGGGVEDALDGPAEHDSILPALPWARERGPGARGGPRLRGRLRGLHRVRLRPPAADGAAARGRDGRPRGRTRPPSSTSRTASTVRAGVASIVTMRCIGRAWRWSTAPSRALPAGASWSPTRTCRCTPRTSCGRSCSGGWRASCPTSVP